VGARRWLRLPLPTLNHNAPIKRDPEISGKTIHMKLLDDNFGISDYLTIMEVVGT
jgi:hypothetical protein